MFSFQYPAVEMLTGVLGFEGIFVVRTSCFIKVNLCCFNVLVALVVMSLFGAYYSLRSPA